MVSAPGLWTERLDVNLGSWSRWHFFEWTVALRFLREGRTQTLFIVAGVALGVAVIVFMAALFVGLQANSIRRLLSTQAHIQLLPSREQPRPQWDTGIGVGAVLQPPLQRMKSIDQWQALTGWLRSHPDVREVAPTAAGSALAVHGEISRAVTLVGIEPDRWARSERFPGRLVHGRLRLMGSEILVGTDLASDQGVGVGDKLRLTAAHGTASTLTIVGIFDLGNKGANARSAFVALPTAQNLLGLSSGVSSIDVQVNDVYQAELIAQRIAAATGVQADSWIKGSAQFFATVRAQNAANHSIQLFVGLSVALGIASMLVVSVVQKSKEIGILRAMGTSRAQVLRVFLLQGAMLGLSGSALGCLLGAGTLLAWQAWALNPDGTPMFTLEFDPGLFASALALATFTGAVSAVAPALRAARLDPVVAIRG